MSEGDGGEMAREQSAAERAALEKMQPGGGLNPKILLIIGAVVIALAVAIIIFVLTMTGGPGAA